MIDRIDPMPYWERYEWALKMGGRMVVDIDNPNRTPNRRQITDYAALIREAKADLDEVRAHNEALR